MSLSIRGDFLKETSEFVKALPDISEQAAMMSLNQVANREGLAMMRRDIESQVAFPKGYLDDENRLGVSKSATRNSLEVVITGRDRPTSLARFAPGQTPENRKGKPVTVQVKRGSSVTLKKAFLVRLNNGNIGLAVRLKPGETLKNRNNMSPVMLAKNVYLLYGPSVDQVFKTVAAESLDELGNMVSREFYRQVTRLSRGK